jgi:hypothetical protein
MNSISRFFGKLAILLRRDEFRATSTKKWPSTAKWRREIPTDALRAE